MAKMVRLKFCKANHKANHKAREADVQLYMRDIAVIAEYKNNDHDNDIRDVGLPLLLLGSMLNCSRISSRSSRVRVSL